MIKNGDYVHVDTTTKNNKNYFNQQHQQLVSYLSLRFERTIIFTINGKNLAQSKIIHYLCTRNKQLTNYAKDIKCNNAVQYRVRETI